MPDIFPIDKEEKRKYDYNTRNELSRLQKEHIAREPLARNGKDGCYHRIYSEIGPFKEIKIFNYSNGDYMWCSIFFWKKQWKKFQTNGNKYEPFIIANANIYFGPIEFNEDILTVKCIKENMNTLFNL